MNKKLNQLAFKDGLKSWKYDVLLFDADRTLLDFNKSEYMALYKVCQEYNIPLDERRHHRYSQINQSMWDMHELGLISRDRLIYKRFEVFFEEENIQVDPIAFEDRYQYLLSEEAYVIDGAFELIRDLSESYDIYIVTNGVKETQMKRLISSGLDKFLKGIFISGEIGYQKPSLEFFQVVFSKINNLEKDKTIIIGDSLTSDIKGGNNAGIDTCWYNPERLKINKDVNVTFEIHDLQTLRNLFTNKIK